MGGNSIHTWRLPARFGHNHHCSKKKEIKNAKQEIYARSFDEKHRCSDASVNFPGAREVI